MADDDGALSRRRALEALRSGVPNREAVRMLGCHQPKVEEKFTELLQGARVESGSHGMLVSGDFGSGKSHLLAHLEREALALGFVCSKVVISKETPLYDLGRVFRSAVENARMPDRQGRLIEELGLAAELDVGRSEKAVRFRQWTDDAVVKGALSPIFSATLLVYEGASDLDLNGKIEAFWAGDRIRVSDVKDGLRRTGQKQAFGFRAPKAADLPPQRLRFVTELIRATGYRGWVVLLDEIELVGSYSQLQRGRSYAELACWLGRVVGRAQPGLIAVGTVTEDFASVNISPDGKKKDRDYVRHKLESSRYADVAPRAETGMRMLERECVGLNTPTEDDVDATLEMLRRIYSDAYGWEAPRLKATPGGVGVRARMRYKVRASINEWDLLRIYPGSSPETVGGEFHHSYQENSELERGSPDDGADIG